MSACVHLVSVFILQVSGATIINCFSTSLTRGPTITSSYSLDYRLLRCGQECLEFCVFLLHLQKKHRRYFDIGDTLRFRMTYVLLFLSAPSIYFCLDKSIRSAYKFTIKAAGIVRSTCKHVMSVSPWQRIIRCQKTRLPCLTFTNL